MNQIIALALFTVGIAGLFWLDRTPRSTDPRSTPVPGPKVSPATWLPTIWLLIGGSRNVGEWLNTGARIDATAAHVDGNAIDKNALALLLFFGFVVLVRRRAQVLQVLRANTPILIYVGYCLLSLVWSDVPMVGVRRWSRMVGDVMMVLVILTDPQPVAALKRILTRCAFVLIPVSLMLIRYFPEMGRSYGQDGSLFWTGVSTGKNGLGITCFIFGFTTVWRLVSAYRDRETPNRRGQLIANGAVLFIACWLLQIANSMTSLMCFAIATGVFLVVTKRKKTNDGTPGGVQIRKPALIHATVISVVLLAGSVLFGGAGGAVLTTMGRDPTLTGRTVIWEIALSFVRSPMLGEGYESFWTPERIAEMARQHAGLTQAHNGYIEVYLNLGLVGVFVLALVILGGYRRAMAMLRDDPASGSLRMVFLVIALIYNCTEGAFKFMTPVWFCFLLGAIASLPAEKTTTESAPVLARRANSPFARARGGAFASR